MSSAIRGNDRARVCAEAESPGHVADPSPVVSRQISYPGKAAITAARSQPPAGAPNVGSWLTCQLPFCVCGMTVYGIPERQVPVLRRQPPSGVLTVADPKRGEADRAADGSQCR